MREIILNWPEEFREIELDVNGGNIAFSTNWNVEVMAFRNILTQNLFKFLYNQRKIKYVDLIIKVSYDYLLCIHAIGLNFQLKNLLEVKNVT